jgi:hypothetical protein
LNGRSTSAELAAPVVAWLNLGAGFLKLLAGAREAFRRDGALAAARAPGTLLGAGAGNGGFRLPAASASRGWMARRGGREAVALDPPRGAFSSPPGAAAEGPAGARRGAPPTPSRLITILGATRRKDPQQLF